MLPVIQILLTDLTGVGKGFLTPHENDRHYGESGSVLEIERLRMIG